MEVKESIISFGYDRGFCCHLRGFWLKISTIFCLDAPSNTQVLILTLGSASNSADLAFCLTYFFVMNKKSCFSATMFRRAGAILTSCNIVKLDVLHMHQTHCWPVTNCKFTPVFDTAACIKTPLLQGFIQIFGNSIYLLAFMMMMMETFEGTYLRSQL